jgi:hypothetical protein
MTIIVMLGVCVTSDRHDKLQELAIILDRDGMVSTYVAVGVVGVVARLQAEWSVYVKAINLCTLQQAICQ